jgi:polysaccharide chain length determinant protein (PEP-CTERM system associated)
MSTSVHFDYKKYLSLIENNKYLFVLVSVFVMTLFLFASYLMPKKYMVQSTVFIEQSVIQELVRGIAVTPTIESKTKVLKLAMLSRTNLLKAFDELDLDLQATDPVQIEQMVNEFRDETRINLDERRGVFIVSLVDQDPVFAKNFVNTLVRNYIQESTASKRDESVTATQFLSEQLEVFKERIDKVEGDINKFKQDKGDILSMNEAVLRSEIKGFEDKLDELNARKTILLAQRNLLERSRVYLDEGNLKTVEAGSSNKHMQLAALEQQIADLKLQYTDKHPEVRIMQRRIDNLKESIQAAVPEDAPEAPVQAQELSVQDSPQYEVLSLELEDLDRQQGTISRNIANKRGLLKQIPLVQAELANLMQKRENEKVIYDQLVARYGKSEVSKQMEMQDKSFNFRIIDPAVVPMSSVGPKREIIILAGMVFGIGAAIGLILLIDYLNPAIKSFDELKKLKIPTLAVVPSMMLYKKSPTPLSTKLLFGAHGLYIAAILAVVCMELLGIEHIDNFIQSLAIDQRITDLKLYLKNNII